MTFNHLNPHTKKNKALKKEKLFIAGSHQVNKKKILKDKSSISKKNIRHTKSSKKSRVVSTSKGKGLKKFSTTASMEWSRKLWLPTKTGYVGSHSNISNGCSVDSESISSLIVRKTIQQKPSSQMTLCQSSMFSLVDTMEQGGTILAKKNKESLQKKLQKQENMKAKKYEKKGIPYAKNKICVSEEDKFMMSAQVIQLLPTSKQLKGVNDWIAASRKVFNCGNHEMKTNNKTSEVFLRDKFVIAKNMTPEIRKSMDWTLRTSKRIREGAIKDLVSCYKSCITRVKKKQIKRFNIKPKDRTASRQTILISSDSSYIKNGKLKTNGLEIQMKEILPDMPIEHNMRLTRIDGLYYIAIPNSKSPSSIKCKSSTENIISIDPGVNMFATYYCPSGEWGEIGIDKKDKIYYDKKHSKLNKTPITKTNCVVGSLKDRLQEFYDKEVSIRRSDRLSIKKQEKALKKITRCKIGMINDFHWKTCHWLLKNFKTILIPRLYVSKSNKKLKQLQNDIRHCHFVDRLIHKSQLYPESQIHECNESYTTKTCTGCLSEKTKISNIIECLSCKLKIHRDLSASRNILIKHLK